MQNFLDTIVSIFNSIVDTIFIAFDYLGSFSNFLKDLISFLPTELTTFLFPLLSISIVVMIYKFVR